jgi:hypothetical protein
MNKLLGNVLERVLRVLRPRKTPIPLVPPCLTHISVAVTIVGDLLQQVCDPSIPLLHTDNPSAVLQHQVVAAPRAITRI